MAGIERYETVINPYEDYGSPTDGFADAINEMFGGMNTYGKKETVGMSAAFIRVLVNIRATQEEIDTACDWFLENEDDFPTPRRFADWIKDRRERLATENLLADAVRRRKEQDEQERRLRNYERYGTEDPTLEQISEYMKGNPIWEEILQSPHLSRRSTLRTMPGIDMKTLRAIEAECEAKDRATSPKGDCE